MGKGGGGKTTQTQESGPYAPARPYIDETLSEAQKLYRSYFKPSTTTGQAATVGASTNPQLADLLAKKLDIMNQYPGGGGERGLRAFEANMARQNALEGIDNQISSARTQFAQPSSQDGVNPYGLPDLVQQGYEQQLAQNNAGISPDILQAVENIRQRANNNPLLNNAESEANKILQGGYLSAENPYFQQVSDRIRQQTLPALDARYAAQGVGGGSAYQSKSAADAIGGKISELAYKNYSDERQRMMSALGYAPTLDQQRQSNNQQLIRAGSLINDLNAQLARERISLGTFAPDYQAAALAKYQNFLRGFNESSATQKSGGSNALGNILGTALTVSSLFGNPFSGAAGAAGAAGTTAGTLASAGLPDTIGKFAVGGAGLA
jgi:hypothetical protein